MKICIRCPHSSLSTPTWRDRHRDPTRCSSSSEPTLSLPQNERGTTRGSDACHDPTPVCLRAASRDRRTAASPHDGHLPQPAVHQSPGGARPGRPPMRGCPPYPHRSGSRPLAQIPQSTGPPAAWQAGLQALPRLGAATRSPLPPPPARPCRLTRPPAPGAGRAAPLRSYWATPRSQRPPRCRLHRPAVGSAGWREAAKDGGGRGGWGVPRLGLITDFTQWKKKA